MRDEQFLINDTDLSMKGLWYGISNLNPVYVEDSIKRFIESGLRIRVTELDIPMGSWANQRQVGLPVTDDELERQALLYKELFRIFIKYSDHIDAVTLWGLADTHSWRARGLPLLFDEYFDAKPSFWAVLNALNPYDSETPSEPDDSDDQSMLNSPDHPDIDPDTDPDTTDPDDGNRNENPGSWWLWPVIFGAVAVFVAASVAIYIKYIKKDRKTN